MAAEWDPDNKGPGMQFTGFDNKTLELTSSSRCSTGIKFNPKADKMAFKVKILKKGTWLAVGMGIKLYNFQDGAYTKIGHGCWMLSYNGFSWHHNLAEQNYKSISNSAYDVGDTIRLEYDRKEGRSLSLSIYMLIAKSIMDFE